MTVALSYHMYLSIFFIEFGDMQLYINIDLPKYGCEYLDDVFSHGFVPVITQPTRVTQASATLIDQYL